MADHPQIPQPPNQPRFRFSLAGLFFAIFGLGFGLAHLQAAPRDWTGVLFASAGGWFIVGMLQRAYRGLTSEANSRDANLFTRFMAVAGPLSLAMMMVIVLTLDIAKYLDWKWLTSDETGDSYYTAADYVDCLLFLTIAWAYADWDSEQSPSPWTRLYEWLGLSLGALWVVLVSWQMMSLPGLIHVATRGVTLAFALRRNGQPFYPAQLQRPLLAEFIDRAALCAGLSFLALVIVWALARGWKRRPAYRVMLVLIWVPLLVLSGILLNWCHRVALPALSPFLFDNMYRQPIAEYVMGGVLVITVATMFAARMSAAIDHSAPSSNPQRTVTIDRHILVILCFLLAVVGELLKVLYSEFDFMWSGWWTWDTWDVIRHVIHLPAYLSIPFMLFPIAATVSLVRALWRRFHKQDHSLPQLRYNGWKFAVPWTMLFVSIPVFVCAMAWWGFAMFLAPARQ